MEKYLEGRLGEVSFFDKNYLRIDKSMRWNKTSPQHIDARSLKRLFADSFFDYKFAVVRHPAIRLRSAYNYAFRIGAVKHISFLNWLKHMNYVRASNPFARDNHAAPMSSLVPDGCTVFRIEDGTTQIMSYIDSILESSDGGHAFPHINRDEPIKERRAVDVLLSQLTGAGRVDELTEKMCRVCYEVYGEDYEKFGYGWRDPLS